MAGVDYKPTIFLFNDTQVLDESFLEDINNILSSGEVPNLYKPDEFEEVSNTARYVAITGLTVSQVMPVVRMLNCAANLFHL